MATASRDYVPTAKRMIANPTAEELRQYTSEMPNAWLTSWNNYNVRARVDARSTGSTYIVSDTPDRHSDQTVSTSEAARLAKAQEDYIRDQEMLLIDGFIGNADSPVTTRARLIIEKANANVAGMQRTLYFTPQDMGPGSPEVTVVYTPNLAVPGYPNDRAILVDLDAGLTRVMNSDYFGESKKGGLRMWNEKVYRLGGLAFHAGAKVVPTSNGDRVMLIVGLSGTGKTSTTFADHNGSLPAQDDFVAWMPGGHLFATEDGCFAKTYGLADDQEPAIYRATTLPTTYLENASQKEAGGPADFFDDSYTQNGRSVFSMADLGSYQDARNMGALDVMLILNKNENIIPGVARLAPEQAAAYFMLGETTGTSAGGVAEMGKFLRVPGTNPFFPLLHEQQGNRLVELLRDHPVEVYLLNTGRVGGGDSDDRSSKVRLADSTAIVRAIAEGTISWTKDPDFGYEVAEGVPGIENLDLLQPRQMYQRQGRIAEHDEMVARLKRERREELAKYPGLVEEIVAAVR